MSTGFDPEPLFKEMGVDPALTADPHARVEEEAVIKLWSRAIKLTGDECLGIKAAKHWHPSSLGALSYAWLASSTLRNALERVARYFRMIDETKSVVLKETAAGLVYTPMTEAGIATIPAEDDLHLAVLIASCRFNYGKKLDPVSVAFSHAQPECSGEYFNHFRCPVEFGAENSSLTLPLEVIDKPLPGKNPMMARLCDKVMIQYLDTLNNDQFSMHVKTKIIDLLPSGDIHIGQIADSLCISTRTLQRRLNHEETNFANLLTEARRELASEYILDGNKPLDQISYLLGFSEISAFSRAFKGWTGMSPSDYVKNCNPGEIEI
jgi:AraC-like DNA-binding protein